MTLTSTGTALQEKPVDKKIIRVSDKRQITIPQKFYQELGFENDAVCYMEGDSIIIKPIARSGRDFSEFILADLLKEGYNGEALLDEFIRRQGLVRPAIESMIEEAKRAALDSRNYTSIDELFDEDE